MFLINLFVALIATHLADSVLQHCVLLIEVVDWFLAHGIVVLWTLQEEAEEEAEEESDSSSNGIFGSGMDDLISMLSGNK